MIYHGYGIQPAPRHLDTGQWGLNLFILWSSNDEERTRHFYTIDEYATEEEARTHCLAYGQQIIDGKIPGSAVG
ncbi:MAG: HlyU family transcriptional regulator [Nitrospira sp. BO4]|nr:HlyU family transcriptional regulator [Nitrospira sp. BO4]